MTRTSLVTLTYASRPAPGVTLEGVVQLVLDASRTNHEIEVSGVLWYHRLLFVQTIEGAPGTIDDLFERICRDDRHSAVTLCERRPIEERRYQHWGMNLVELEQPDATVEEVASRIVGLPIRVDDATDDPASPAEASPELAAEIESLLP